jgi:hypothetical protein
VETKELAVIDEAEDVVRYVTQSTQKTVPLPEFLKYLAQNTNHQTSVSPRWLVASNSDKSKILCEFPPEWRELKTSTWFGNDKDVNILFPWTYFYIEFKGASTVRQCIYFRNTPIDKTIDEFKSGADESELLFVPPLSNLYSGHEGSKKNCEICMGSTLNYSRIKGKTISERVNSFVDAFFDSYWNADLDSTHHTYMPAEIKEYARENFGYGDHGHYNGQLFDAWSELGKEGRFSFEWTSGATVRGII